MIWIISTTILIVVYLAIGLTLYFTFPNRKMLPINVTMPIIIAWFFVCIYYLFLSKKKEDVQGGGE